MQLVSGAAAVEQVLEGLAQRRESLVNAVVSEAGAIGGYAALEESQAVDFAETVGEGFDAVLRAMADQRAFADEDVAFLWWRIRTRTEAGVSEGEMLAVVRLFQRALWEAIIELAPDDEDGRAAALILARPLIGYIDVLSRVVNEAFKEAEEALSSRASVVRQSVVEILLAGSELAPGMQLGTARRAGLDLLRPLVVIVARPVGEALDQAALGVAAIALARAEGDAIEPLAVVRQDEIVVLRAMPEGVRLSTESLQSAARRLEERRLSLAVGVSTVHDGLADVPAAYDEACLALEQLRDVGGVLALSELSVADYLIRRAGDGTAWRLVPPEVRRFVEDDLRQSGVLSATLLAYVSCDLSVKLAAERLYVHPNTAHYRLAKIEDRTGCSMRRLTDVLLLAIAIRLEQGSAHRRPAPPEAANS
jgi:sugar diacid utilization regulator